MGAETRTLRRRTLLLGAVAVPLAGASLAGCGAAAEVQVFPNAAAAARAVESLLSGHRSTGAWNLAQVLNHAAQSIEFSLDGFPEPKPAWFQASVGRAAFAWFDSRGAMSHSLAEPIPGAPVLDAAAPLPQAVARMIAALQRFEVHTGPLKPHFAYGALDKAQYTRAHLMHLANHWREIRRDAAAPASA